MLNDLFFTTHNCEMVGFDAEAWWNMRLTHGIAYTMGSCWSITCGTVECMVIFSCRMNNSHGASVINKRGPKEQVVYQNKTIGGLMKQTPTEIEAFTWW